MRLFVQRKPRDSRVVQKRLLPVSRKIIKSKRRMFCVEKGAIGKEMSPNVADGECGKNDKDVTTS